MKTIKKVAVTPVTPNTGDIIDSFSTTDDKHTNAPSINAVENKLLDYKVNGDFAVVEGTITMPEAGAGVVTGTQDISYPNGFSSTNCVVVSIMSHNTLHVDYWSTPMTPSSATELLGNGDVCVTLQPTLIRVRSDKSADKAPRKDVTFKIVLMKVS